MHGIPRGPDFQFLLLCCWRAAVKLLCRRRPLVSGCPQPEKIPAAMLRRTVHTPVYHFAGDQPDSPCSEMQPYTYNLSKKNLRYASIQNLYSLYELCTFLTLLNLQV